METVTQIQVAWELYKAGQRVDAIAAQLDKYRSTICRRLKGIWPALRTARRGGDGARPMAMWSSTEPAPRLSRLLRGETGASARIGGHPAVAEYPLRILKRHLVLRKKRAAFKGEPVQAATKPRQVLQVDTVDLGAVYAYTAIDAFTREAAIVMRPSLQAADGKVALAQIAARFGPVDVLQTDGGSEFKAECAASLQRYCVQHRVARPYKKNEQAFIEAFNGTLRREEFGHTSFTRDDLAQKPADAFLEYYHQCCLHLALGLLTPAQFVQSIAESHLI